MEPQTAGVVKVTSADGTPIAYWPSGQGPPLVLVHGTSVDHTSFQWLQPLLAPHCTLYLLDRRGRGGSGDVPSYAIEREFEDVATFVDTIGGPVDLLGHSYGATVALGAARLARNLRKLVLYEPAPGVVALDQQWLTRLDALLARGDREELLQLFLREVGMSAEEIQKLRASPLWSNRVALAHTIPRELRAEEGWTVDPAQFRELRTPTLLLLGSESPAWAQTGTTMVQRALRASRIHVLPGQGHIATLTAPDLVATAVLRFLAE
jgi:pimeloyl-ACP methyl ester carboxylesterase